MAEHQESAQPAPLAGRAEAPPPAPIDAAAAVRPRRRDEVRTYPVLDDLVLYDPRHDVAVSLNVTAAAIWELCDGTRSPQEIFEEIAAVVQLKEQALVSDIERTLCDLRALGLLVDPQPTTSDLTIS